MRYLLAVLTLTAVTFGQSVTCSHVGSFTFCDNGLDSQRVGSFTFFSDGTTAQRIGSFTFYNLPAGREDARIFEVPADADSGSNHWIEPEPQTPRHTPEPISMLAATLFMRWRDAKTQRKEDARIYKLGRELGYPDNEIAEAIRDEGATRTLQFLLKQKFTIH